ncbi:PIKK/TRRAP protein kinase Tra1 [Schizosaccharomyces pombe]
MEDGFEKSLSSSIELLKAESTEIEEKIKLTKILITKVPSISSDASQLYAELIPLLLDFLRNTEVNLYRNSSVNELKIGALTLIQSCAHRDEFKQYAQSCVLSFISLIKADNEEVAVFCLKVIMDIFKTFKFCIESTAQPFFDLVLELSTNLPYLIPSIFVENPKSNEEENTTLAFGSYLSTETSIIQQRVNSLAISTQPLELASQSFRVYVECPVIIVLILQAYRQAAFPGVQAIIPCFLKMVQIDVPIDIASYAMIEKDSSIDFIEFIRNKYQYRNFFMAQVKTLSFLAYILRTHPNTLSEKDIIPDIVIKLLRRCPFDMCFARKELLVATRHILSTNLKSLFVKKLDFLLDLNILLGNGVGTQKLLRPLAFSTLADLLHHVRDELNETQIRKSIMIYSTNMHDLTLSIGLQTMGARLILNMVDRMISLPSIPDAIFLLLSIFDSFVNKFSELNDSLDQFFKKKYEEEIKETKSPTRSSPRDLSSFSTSVNDGSFLFKNLMFGLRALMYGLRTCKSRCIEIGGEQFSGFLTNIKPFEAVTFQKLFFEVGKGFSYFRPEQVYLETFFCCEEESLDRPAISTLPRNKDEKDCLEVFATIFIHLEPSIFLKVFETNLPTFFDQLKKNLTLFHIPQFLLSNESTSSKFLNILLRFLLSRIEELGSSDIRHGSVLLRLFRLSFVTVSMFATENEPVLRPYVSEIIVKCMKLAPNSANSLNYYYLLRALFRGIGGGRFESLYKEVMPLLHALLEAFNSLLISARTPKEKDLFTELCLTIPVRLSLLLPYMSYLMRPLVMSLKSSQELVSQGLRTFELCLDNLTPDFLDPIMAPYIEDLMNALWSHLQPLPYNYNHSHTALKILGKLGGRNRKLLDRVQSLKNSPEPNNDFTLLLSIKGVKQPQLLHYTQYVDEAVNLLSSPSSDLEVKQQAFTYVCNISKLYVYKSDATDSLASSIRCTADKISKSNFDFRRPYSVIPSRMTGRSSFTQLSDDSDETIILASATYGLFFATTVDELREEAYFWLEKLAVNVIVHDIFYAFDVIQGNHSKFTTNLQKEVIISPHYFAHCLSEVVCNDNSKMGDAVKHVLKFMFSFLESIFENPERAFILPIFEVLLSDFRHKCYDPHWYKKYGGCFGLECLIEQDHSSKWLFDRQVDILTALFFTLKDTTSEVPTVCKDHVMDVLKQLFRKIYASKDTEIAPGILGHLVLELSNHNSVVRSSTQKLLSLLSELSNTPIVKLVSPFKERLLSPIFAKPLRALPFHIQIGHIDAVNYCISLGSELITFSDELIRLIHETTALAEADDDALIGIGKTSHFKNAALLIRLRVVCVELLSTCILKIDFNNPQHAHLREGIIVVFFKSLYAKSKELIEAASLGLKNALQEDQKLSKELLQTTLRPILYNISDYRRLSVAGLEGLGRLLRLLTNYFKVEIGRKLLDHLKALLENVDFQKVSSLPLFCQTEMKIVRALIDLFHLLPNNANRFMDELLICVVEFSLRLQRTFPNYFSEPLLKYVNRYPEDAWKFFMVRYDEAAFTSVFVELLRLKDSDPLLSVVKDNWLFFQTILTNEINTVTANRYSFALDSAIVILQRDPSFFKDKNDFFRGSMDAVLAISHLVENESILESMVFWNDLLVRTSTFLLEVYDLCIYNYDDGLKLLSCFHMYKNSLAKNLVSDLTAHLVKKIEEPDLENNVKLILNLILSKDYGFLLKENLAGILLTYLNQNVSSLEKCNQIFSIFYEVFFQHPSTNVYANDEGIKIGALQIISFFLKNVPEITVQHQTEMLKMCSLFGNSEDVMIKQLSIYVMSLFILRSQFPYELVNVVYMALLKSSPIEVRHLVKSSFDNIFSYIFSEEPESKKSPIWFELPLQVISSQSQNISQLLNVYDFISSHSDIFIEHRERYVPILIDSLYKFGAIPNPNPEIRALSLGLIKVLLEWNDLQLKVDQKEIFSNNQKRAILSYLFRFVCLFSEPFTEGLCSEAISLLERLLSSGTWASLGMKLSFFTKSITHFDATDANSVMFANSLRTLSIVVGHSDSAWIEENLSDLKFLLEKSLENESVGVQSAIGNFVSTILTLSNTHPSITGNPIFNDIWTSIASWTERRLQSCSQIEVTLPCVECFFKYKKDALHTLLPGFMRCFHKVAKEFLSLGSQPSGNSLNLQIVNAVDERVSILKSMIELGCSYISYLGDQRRWFLSALVQIIEKSSSYEICNYLLEIVRGWIMNSPVPVPTVKEKAALLLKMVTFEGRFSQNEQNDLFNKYLSFIADIYEMEPYKNSELTFRLEAVYLLGTRVANKKLKERFIKGLNSSLPSDLFSRFQFLLGSQHWESLSNTYWIVQLNIFLSRCFDLNQRCQFYKKPKLFSCFSIYCREFDEDLTSQAQDTEVLHNNLLKYGIIDFNQNSMLVSDFVLPVLSLQFSNSKIAEYLWRDFFNASVCSFTKDEIPLCIGSIISFLSREYHIRLLGKTPNVLETILTSILSSDMPIPLPPHLLVYLSKTYGLHHYCILLLENSLQNNPGLSEDELTVYHKSCLDALSDIYYSLDEHDLYHGLWRRRANFLETEVATSHEQCHEWEKAQLVYEHAQLKVCTGSLPYSPTEHGFWLDHWILCAQKLNQWDVLFDFSKQEGCAELYLECAWRLSDWSTEQDTLEKATKSLSPFTSLRRHTADALLYLNKTQRKMGSVTEFSRIIDECMQFSLRRWQQLPKRVYQSHVSLLHHFQEIVELQEAFGIYSQLNDTNIHNIDNKLRDIKVVLQGWRERLPNVWDDIDIWSDLIAWRQSVFKSINKVFLPLVSIAQQSANNSNTNSVSYLYRGYHELAWIINRFAHVARVHNLPEVCINQLTKIYTLPNIEIQEAFLKLREQAECHYESPSEMQLGLEVINNTNLMYFRNRQKAEFFTLKGMFQNRLGEKDEANQAFATAVQIDIGSGKAWSEWGLYHDELFQANPQEIHHACNAVSCFLQASSLLSSSNSKPLLTRVLWLLSVDDSHGSVSEVVSSFKSEIPTWNWIPFIPQLLSALSHRESIHARAILIQIAKTYPQSLHFQLRTAYEDFLMLKKQQAANVLRGNSRLRENDSSSDNKSKDLSPSGSFSSVSQFNSKNGSPSSIDSSEKHQISTVKPAWELIADVTSILKTAYPLLALTMETMVDQIHTRLKSFPEEDAYRLIVALLNDGLQYISRLGVVSKNTFQLPMSQANIQRFAENVLPVSVREAFLRDFVETKLDLLTYVDKLRMWRKKIENILDQRPKFLHLEQCSLYLSEFQHQKFDEVEIPGQYLLDKNNNNDFVRLERFVPNVDLVRGHTMCYKRLTLRGYDGKLYPFALQYPATRHSRREERMLQLLGTFNTVLRSKIEIQNRNFSFQIPSSIPLSSHMRIIADKPSYVTMQTISDEYCKNRGMPLDYGIRFYFDRLQTGLIQLKRASASMLSNSTVEEKKQIFRQRALQLRMQLLETLNSSVFPESIYYDYFYKTFERYSDFWFFRRTFTTQYAYMIIMTYVFNIGGRSPQKLFIVKDSGQVMSQDLLPSMTSNQPVFHNTEAVPFRLTPPIQYLISDLGVEGLLSGLVMSIAQSLSSPTTDIKQYLSLYVRDEVFWWSKQQRKPIPQGIQLFETVKVNVELLFRRISVISHNVPEDLPLNQTLVDLVSQATNPQQLAQMDQLWQAWL